MYMHQVAYSGLWPRWSAAILLVIKRGTIVIFNEPYEKPVFRSMFKRKVKPLTSLSVNSTNKLRNVIFFNPGGHIRRSSHWQVSIIIIEKEAVGAGWSQFRKPAWYSSIDGSNKHSGQECGASEQEEMSVGINKEEIPGLAGK